MTRSKALQPKSMQNGFTLIELLVVIAIIAILAAILFPVFAKAREKAREIGDVSNMKQIGLAILQYEQDNDEMLNYSNIILHTPTTQAQMNMWTTADWCDGGALSNMWMDWIYPYVKTKSVFYSTEQPNINYGNAQPIGYWLGGQNYCSQGPILNNPEGNYGYVPNGFILWDWVWDGNFVPATGSCLAGANRCESVLSSTKITRPDQIALLADRGEAEREDMGCGGAYCITPFSSGYTPYVAGPDPDPINDAALLASGSTGMNPGWKWQGQFANILFCDGHVKAMQYGSDAQYYSMLGASPYGI